MLSRAESLASFGRQVAVWWREPVDYTGQVEYFAKRSMSEAIQVLIGLGTAVVAVASFLLQVTLFHPDGVEPGFAAALFSAATLFWAFVWCFRPWPSRPMSMGFVVTSDAGIVLLAFQDPTWLTGLFGLNALTLISVYLMFFDGPKTLVLHLAWTFAATVAFSLYVPMGPHFDRGMFIGSAIAAVIPLVTTPLGIQFGIWTLRNDANESVTDPLTGLLNRRGLHLHFGEMLRNRRNSHLAVMVVDLDHFKAINDAYGHATGDDVLIRSARQIESVLRGTALVARTGGEEFVVIDAVEPAHTLTLTERIRSSIAAPTERTSVTASIGVTHAELAVFIVPGADAVALLDAVIGRADLALLEAKRRGGNTTMHLPMIDG
ncbi:GGDEF domain-containing protein [Mycolicibacterium sp.]|uniref:GGDEF domain-containing protein n=1 Tax=Mycolicibacterium sp. TaxID=2320850 RepID=UPI003D0F5CA7